MKIRRVIYNRYLKLRIIATLIDYGIYFIFIFIYNFFFGNKNDSGEAEVKDLLALPIFIFWFLYFVVLETVNQTTPGHDICKLIVIKANGEDVGMSDAFKRRLLDPIDIFFCGILAILCIIKTPKFQRLGDLWADTVVVKKSDIVETKVIF